MTPTPPFPPQPTPSPAPEALGRRRGSLLVPALLGILALWDLRIELRLLADHFTWAAVAAAIRSHPLAVVVVLVLPSLVQQARGRRRSV